MERLIITGVSGYIGSKLVSRLNEMGDVHEIIGIDKTEPKACLSKLTFYRKDIRDPLEQILIDHNVDTVVHLAYVVSPIHSKSLMEDININGTKNVLSACASAGVNQILYTSSATAYGFYPDNDVPLTEDSPLRGNDDFTYSKTKKEIEAIFSGYVQQNPQIAVSIIRPAFVVGPGFSDPLARHLRKKLVMLPWTTAPFQFVHEDDLIDIICLLLEKQGAGIFNVGADGTITSKEMIGLLGNIAVRLPFKIMYMLTWLAWTLRLSFLAEFPSPALNLARYPWIVSSDKLKRELGYEYKYTTLEAYKDFAREVRGASG